MSVSDHANAAIVRAFVEVFWNERDIDRADEFLSPDYIDHAYTPHTASGLKRTAGELAAAFPDHRTTIEDVVAQEDRVMTRMVLRGTHGGPFRGAVPTGNPIEVAVYRTYRLADGKIAEHWALLDTATLLRQIGAQPSPETACKRA
ncbi:MAG: ester cyclase [Thermomicrobiales bacterium]